MENLTRAELLKKDEELLAFWRTEKMAEGSGLRSDVAKANVAEIEKQRKAIWELVEKMPRPV